MSERKDTAPKKQAGFGGMRPDAMMQGQKAKDFKGTMKQLLGYLGSYKWTILFVWILAVISTLFTIVAPKILGKATDELFTGIMNQIAGTGGINFGVIGEIILWLAGLTLSVPFFPIGKVL